MFPASRKQAKREEEKKKKGSCHSVEIEVENCSSSCILWAETCSPPEPWFSAAEVKLHSLDPSDRESQSTPPRLRVIDDLLSGLEGLSWKFLVMRAVLGFWVLGPYLARYEGRFWSGAVSSIYTNFLARFFFFFPTVVACPKLFRSVHLRYIGLLFCTHSWGRKGQVAKQSRRVPAVQMLSSIHWVDLVK